MELNDLLSLARHRQKISALPAFAFTLLFIYGSYKIDAKTHCATAQAKGRKFCFAQES